MKKKQRIIDQGTRANCGSLPFNHMTSKQAKIYKEEDKKSKVLANLKKGEDLLFVSPGKDKKWYFVKYRIDKKSCADGYIKQTDVISKDIEVEEVVVPKDILITIEEPQWSIENELILVDAEGGLSLIGKVAPGEIDEIIESYTSFAILSKNRKKLYEQLEFFEEEGLTAECEDCGGEIYLNKNKFVTKSDN